MSIDLQPLLLNLQDVARQRSTTQYAAISHLVELDMALQCDRTRIGQMLGELSENEHKHGRPMISAVVVGSDTGTPGTGFFNLARRLGLWTEVDQDAFHIQELRRVYAYWSETPALQTENQPETVTATHNVASAPTELNSETIVERLIEFGSQIGSAELVFDLDPLVGNLVKDDPFAFLLAASVDRGMKAETAWRLPGKMRKALGHLDPSTISRMTSDEMLSVLKSIDGKPRYLSASARTLVEVAGAVTHEYDGDARNLWKNKSAATIKHRMQRFHGVGPGIAAMVVNLLSLLNEVELGAEDYAEMDPKPDVHVQRVFARLGLCSRNPTERDVVNAARYLNPSYPGKLDGPSWHIGQTGATPPTRIAARAL